MCPAAAPLPDTLRYIQPWLLYLTFMFKAKVTQVDIIFTQLTRNETTPLAIYIPSYSLLVFITHLMLLPQFHLISVRSQPGIRFDPNLFFSWAFFSMTALEVKQNTSWQTPNQSTICILSIYIICYITLQSQMCCRNNGLGSFQRCESHLRSRCKNIQASA